MKLIYIYVPLKLQSYLSWANEMMMREKNIFNLCNHYHSHWWAESTTVAGMVHRSSGMLAFMHINANYIHTDQMEYSKWHDILWTSYTCTHVLENNTWFFQIAVISPRGQWHDISPFHWNKPGCWPSPQRQRQTFYVISIIFTDDQNLRQGRHNTCIFFIWNALFHA